MEGTEPLITLFWQGVPIEQADEAELYTAFVHLRDRAGRRISGYDVLLRQEDASKGWEDVFITRHPMALPDGTPPGEYDLAVGLYRFEDGKPVPGSTIVLPEAVTLP
jgi:hypothetical protein